MDRLLYGAAYYDEYMPCDRLAKDIEMMQAAGMNVVRIGESTWATCEPQPGVFDFSHVTRVIDAMEDAGMYVIVGTPTYAIPSWLERMHPEVMAVQKGGRHLYGARQCMYITNPAYLYYSERVIRKMMEAVAGRKAVIGFQLDNETKYYDTAGSHVQQMFVRYLKDKFSHDENNVDLRGGRLSNEVAGREQTEKDAAQGVSAFGAGNSAPGRLSDEEALERMNRAFGLDYWSNRISSWEDFPDVRGTINGSLAAEFDRFRRRIVADFLSWQASVVREYARPDQFITHNFDYEWRDWSFGVQPAVDHFRTAARLANRFSPMIAGCDIYHPSQDSLTGREIAFGGDLNRSLLQKNYLVLETEAQGYPWWTPYPGQLRLQAYSHLASGADMVEYWHWHSIHNSFETYWKGVLSHDFEENDVYREAKVVGNEWKVMGDRLLHLKKNNKAAILVSNDSLTALQYFKIDAVSGDSGKTGYNDIVRWVYDALFDMNIECDFVSPETEDLSGYRLLVVPALYCAPQETLERINEFARKGGVVVETFKSGFTDENVKVWADVQPHELNEGAGIIYHEFAFPTGVGLRGPLKDDGAGAGLQGPLKDDEAGAGLQGPLKDDEAGDWNARLFMEFLEPRGAEVLLSYDHPAWGKYSAVTRNRYGAGAVYYIGCMTAPEVLKKILSRAAEDAGIELPDAAWPLIVRRGTNQYGKEITYLLNYSDREQTVTWSGEEAEALLPKNKEEADIAAGKVRKGSPIRLRPWGVQILER